MANGADLDIYPDSFWSALGLTGVDTTYLFQKEFPVIHHTLHQLALDDHLPPVAEHEYITSEISMKFTG